MNYSMIFYIIGWILDVEAALLVPSLAVSLIYHESCALAFFITIVLCLIPGVILVRKQPKNKVFYAREGSVTVALSWIVMSIMGSIPFLLSGSITNPVDALFETVSGFTTTGASILPAVEPLQHGVLFWRSFTHWIGGMGVLVFLLCLLPLTGNGYHMNLMKAESPGPSVTKLVPKVQSTAKILYGIYFALTVLELVFLMLGGMPLFESMLTAFGTAGTGGFGFKNDSFTSFSPYIQWVVTIFMILFGVNFNAYFLLLLRKFNRAISEEVRGYFAIILVAIGIITANIYSLYNSFGEAVRQAAFQVGSIITTTGFSSCDFDLWPTLSKEILVVLMFIGACAGSTGGGIKVSRLLILGKTLGKELKQALHPQVVAPVRMDGKLLNHETIRTTNVFMGAYFFIFVVSFLLISLDGFDMVTNFTAIAATLNNIGPGLAQVGPMMNFGSFTNPAKLVMIFDMLAGRLEIFPMLVLFLPDTWRRF